MIIESSSDSTSSVNKDTNYLDDAFIFDPVSSQPTEFSITTKNDTAEYSELFHITQQITGLYVLPFIIVFGICGNIFNVVVFKQSKKCSTNFYLIVLSLSDILKLVNDFNYFLVNFISKLDSDLGNKVFNTLYLYSHYIFVVTAINTSWLTCAIALDRYLIVASKGDKNSKHNNYIKSIVISLSIIVTSIIIAVPSPLFLASVNEIDPHTNTTVAKVAETALNQSNFRKIYNYFNAMFRAFIPLIVILYLNYNIVRVVYKNKMKKKSQTTKSKGKSKSRVTLMLISIVLSFTICMFPDAIMTMMQLGYANESYAVRTIREITDLLLAINSTTTFPICYYFSIQYRNLFKKVFLFEKVKPASNVTVLCADENISNFDVKSLQVKKHSVARNSKKNLVSLAPANIHEYSNISLCK